MKFISSFFLAIILLASCSKESIPTQAQVTAAKLKSDLSPYHISNISIYYNNLSVVTNGTGYLITDDGFITVSAINFNLGQLKFYQISPPSLTLYF